MSDKYYVYLLRDPRESDFHRSIFYIGKGTGARALAHRGVALTALDFEDDSSHLDPATKRAKEHRLREIHELGLVETVDVLVGPQMEPISEQTAFAIESALIEVLGHGQLDGLTNRVRGHTIRLMPGRVLSLGSDAPEVELPADLTAVIVPVNGVWGGRDYAGTLIQATDDEIWENSRRTWSRFSKWRQHVINDRAYSDNPVYLIALAEDPSKLRANIIVGVYPLTSAYESTAQVDRKGGCWRANGKSGETSWVDEYNGWVLERDTRAANFSWDLLHHVLTVNGIPKRRPQDRAYLGSW